MKNFLAFSESFLIIVLCISSLIAFKYESHAQAGEWTWMKGDNQPLSPGNFGTQGVSSPTNLPPAHYSYTPWKDLQGNFWIFGGDAAGAFHNDLWKYDPLTNDWTWVRGTGLPSQPGVYGTQGIPSPANTPGARTYGSRSWTCDSNYLWLCGGDGYAAIGSGELNDLWRYDIASNEWTWMKGNNTVNPAGVYGTFQTPDALNTPNGRHEATACWNDADGNLWFYGGSVSSDMWKYDLSINEWAWMNGTSGFVFPSYGVQGVPSVTNTPGSRLAYSHSVDGVGNFLIFGGASPYLWGFADLWSYDPVTNEWTWINGSQIIDDGGNAGPLCDTSLLYYPQSRFENRCCWTDTCGRFWITGGTHDIFNSGLNDLWVYDPLTFKWTWVNGSLSGNAPTVTGIQGVSAPDNNPGGLICSMGFVDASNNLYQFGGSKPGLTPFNDLWRYVIDPDCPASDYGCGYVSQASFASSDTGTCEKFCINFFDQSLNNPTAWQWIFQGAEPASSPDQNPMNICYNIPGIYDVTLITVFLNGTDTLKLTNYVTVNATPPFPTITQVGYTLISSTASSYQWQHNAGNITGATTQSYNVLQTGLYTVIIGDSNGCVNSESTYVLFTGVNEINTDADISIYPNPSTGSFTVEIVRLTAPSGLTDNEVSIDVLNTLGQPVFSSSEKITSDNCKIEIDACGKEASYCVSTGIYFIEIKTQNIFLKKKIIITH